MPIHSSSTATDSRTGPIPRHIAIIMDGNGRWAKQRFLPRVAGHRRGGEAVRATVRACAERGVEYLTLFAFSSRELAPSPGGSFGAEAALPPALEDEVEKLHEVGIRLRVIGNRHAVRPENRRPGASRRSAHRWQPPDDPHDRRQLWRPLGSTPSGERDGARRDRNAHGAFSEEDLAPYLALNYAPEPDLFIRTGGEQRISNFLLWQLAYTELYFTETLWPDFDAAALDIAIASYRQRERRFGRTSEQLPGAVPGEQRLPDDRNRRREFA